MARGKQLGIWILALCLLLCSGTAYGADAVILGESPVKEGVENTCDVVLAVDANSGEVLLSKNAESVYTITGAPVFWMTALTALDYVELSDAVENRVSSFGLPDNAVVLGIRRGQSFTVRDLIAAMVLYGAQDAAIVLRNYALNAAYAAGKIESTAGTSNGNLEEEEESAAAELDPQAFVTLMNQKAAALGMASTKYVHAYGMGDPAQVSCGRDELLLLRAVMENKALFRLMRLEQYTMETANERLNGSFRTTQALMDSKSTFFDKRVWAAARASDTQGAECMLYAQTEVRDLLSVLWCSNATGSEADIFAKQLVDQYGAIGTADILPEVQKAAKRLSVPYNDVVITDWAVEAEAIPVSAYKGFAAEEEKLELTPDMGTVYVTEAGDTELTADIVYDGQAVGTVQLTTNRAQGNPLATPIPIYTQAETAPPTLLRQYGWAFCIGGAVLLGGVVYLIGKGLRDNLK